MDFLDASAWAMGEFGRADLGHRARTKRLVQVATDVMRAPAASIPMAIQDSVQAKGAYRFLSNPAVTADGILSGHVRATARRCVASGTVLALQDTTTLTFHSRAGLVGLGPINDRATTKGFFAHTTLAVARDSHEVLGVLHQHTFVRSAQKKPAKETAMQRKLRSRESEHWADNQRSAHRILGEVGAADGHALPHVIAVFDREGDIFEALEVLRDIGHGFVIRAQRNRLLDADDGAKHYSLDEVRTAPVIAHSSVAVRARAGKPARVATLELRALSVSIRPPRNRGRKGDCLNVNIVLAEEVRAAPEVTDPLCWYLVTSEPIATPADVLEVVRDYVARWIIEEFHMGLKSGCACEERQMETAHALMNFLALATPMACSLLQLRDASRRNLPIEQCNILTASEMAVLRIERPKAMPKATTARHLMRIVANFGGFLNRNSDPDPGWRTLWRGLERVRLLGRGFDLQERCAPAPSSRENISGQ